MSDWQTLPLGSLVVVLDSQRVPVRSAQRRPGSFPYYGASGIVDYVEGFIFEGLHLLIAEDGENLRSRKTPVAFLASGKFWVNNHAHVLQGNADNDTRFLAYAVEASDISGYLSGSTQPKLTQRNLTMIPIKAPGLREQQAIARTLGALDDLIESRRRIVDMLRSFLDATIDQLSVALPAVPLGDLTEATRTTANPSSFGSNPVDHFSLPAFDAANWPERVAGTSIMSNKLKLDQDSVLVSRLNPRFNRTWWAIPEPGIPALASTEFSALTPSLDGSLAGLWLAVRSHSFRDELPRRVTGTSGSHQRVRPADLLSIDVPDTRALPDDTLEAAFALLQAAQSYLKQIRLTSSLRDTLIPSLLSESLGVSEVHHQLADVAA